MPDFTIEELKHILSSFSPTQCDFLSENCIVALEKNKHKKVTAEIARHSDYTDKQDYSQLNFASEPEFNYDLQQMPDFRSVFEKFLAPKTRTSKIYSRILSETTSIILVFVDSREMTQHIFFETLKSFQTYYQYFDVNSFAQARTLLYLMAHYHGKRYRRDNDIKGKIDLAILETVLQLQDSRSTIRNFFTAFDRLPTRTIKILDLLLEGATTSEIANQMGLATSTVHNIKNKAMNLLPDSK